MAKQELGIVFQGKESGHILRCSRKDLASSIEAEYTEPEEAAMLRCFQRLAAVPKVEGLALSRIKISGGLYYTVIHRQMLERGNEEAGKSLEEVFDAIHAFGDALGEVMPGSFLCLPEGKPFSNAARYLKSKRYVSELNLVGIVHFV